MIYGYRNRTISTVQILDDAICELYYTKLNNSVDEFNYDTFDIINDELSSYVILKWNKKTKESFTYYVKTILNNNISLSSTILIIDSRVGIFSNNNLLKISESTFNKMYCYLMKIIRNEYCKFFKILKSPISYPKTVELLNLNANVLNLQLFDYNCNITNDNYFEKIKFDLIRKL